MPALKYEYSDLTATDRKNCRSRLREAVREAKIANDDLYSLGEMASFDLYGALNAMTDEEFIENSNKIIDFHTKVEEMLNNIDVVLPGKFDMKKFRREFNKVGAVMSWASTNFDYDNPVLDFIGEED